MQDRERYLLCFVELFSLFFWKRILNNGYGGMKLESQTIYIETPRLLLRDWKEEDSASFSRMNSDKEVMKYFPKTLSAEETTGLYQKILTEFKESGYGLYAAEIKENNEFIGFIGFHKALFDADFTPCIEIGWRLKKEAWGKGYATEGALACLEYGARELKFPDIYSFTASINQPSRNVMEKSGLNYIKHFDHPNMKEGSKLVDHVLYHIHYEQ